MLLLIKIVLGFGLGTDWSDDDRWPVNKKIEEAVCDLVHTSLY